MRHRGLHPTICEGKSVGVYRGKLVEELTGECLCSYIALRVACRVCRRTICAKARIDPLCNFQPIFYSLKFQKIWLTTEWMMSPSVVFVQCWCTACRSLNISSAPGRPVVPVRDIKHSSASMYAVFSSSFKFRHSLRMVTVSAVQVPLKNVSLVMLVEMLSRYSRGTRAEASVQRTRREDAVYIKPMFISSSSERDVSGSCKMNAERICLGGKKHDQKEEKRRKSPRYFQMMIQNPIERKEILTIYSCCSFVTASRPCWS